MKRAMLVISMLMFVCAGFSLAQETTASENTPNQTTEPEKKVYVIGVAEGYSSTGYTLTDIETVDFNGLKCIKGKFINRSWLANKVVYIPQDKVQNIAEFDSLQAYQDARETYNRKKME